VKVLAVRLIGFSGPLHVFFVSLAILGPLLAVLVALVRSEGVWLANAVLVMDVCANWWGNRHWLQDDPARLRRLLPITLVGLFTLFGLFAVASLLPLHRTVAGTAGRRQAALPSA